MHRVHQHILVILADITFAQRLGRRILIRAVPVTIGAFQQIARNRIRAQVQIRKRIPPPPPRYHIQRIGRHLREMRVIHRARRQRAMPPHIINRQLHDRMKLALRLRCLKPRRDALRAAAIPGRIQQPLHLNKIQF